MKYIVGIVTRKIIIDQKVKYFVNQTYFNFFKEKIILIPLNKYNFDSIKHICDGFIIPGGDDINPKYYHQDNVHSLNIDDEIDEIDFKVMDYAFKKNKTLLGICRGIQIINVYFNGTLNQQVENHLNTLHRISFNSSNKEAIVNSFHHQAIDKLGDDLVIVAKNNQIIEYIKHKSKNIFGVQFHVELLDDEIAKKILNLFVSYMQK